MRYDAVLLPCFSIARSPGRPVILVPKIAEGLSFFVDVFGHVLDSEEYQSSFGNSKLLGQFRSAEVPP